MMHASPTVQAIIVTWNKKKDVLALLSQLKGVDYPADRLSIMVVDNASTDGTVQAIETGHPGIRILQNSENLGGAGGFNAGMRWTLANRPQTDYLWLLDNDVCVDPKALQVLVRVLEQHSHAGLCGSRIMDVDHREHLIEAGAFIDYRIGDVRRHQPDVERLKDPDAVFKVDYVAACSLLARVSMVKELGVWHDAFFIYWDDMEWGARFNAAGYEVLAANGSIVYHPSWVGRMADQTAIWRNYYRSRNSLWFFNQYGAGIRKRLLLCKMVTRYSRFALSSAINASNGLSRAFVRGIEDFFSNDFGKKGFPLQVASLAASIDNMEVSDLMVFVADPQSSNHARCFVEDLVNRYPGLKIRCILPKQVRHHWRGHPFVQERLFFARNRTGGISFADKYKIWCFLQSLPWQVFVSSAQMPKLGTLWGRPVARIDYPSKRTLSIDRMKLKAVMRIVLRCPVLMIRALFFTPKPGRATRPL